MHPLEDNVIINCILLCYHIMKQIVSMLPRVCTVIDHRRNNYGKIKKVTHKVQPHFYIFCDLVLNRTIEHKWIPVLLSSSDVSVPDSTEFQSLKEFVSEKTLNAITDMGFTNMMEIQHKSIVPLLKGRYSMIPMFGV